jgi:hypothetical protein
MMSGLAWFTGFHTAISLIAIVLGLLAIREAATGRAASSATRAFLATALITSVTGFMFPLHGFTPALGVGCVALVVLIWTLVARRNMDHSSSWAAQYPIGLVLSEYFLVFVLIAQIFAKLPALNTIEPNTRQAWFGGAELVVLLIFVATAVLTTKAFKTRHAAAAMARTSNN